MLLITYSAVCCNIIVIIIRRRWMVRGILSPNAWKERNPASGNDGTMYIVQANNLDLH